MSKIVNSLPNQDEPEVLDNSDIKPLAEPAQAPTEMEHRLMERLMEMERRLARAEFAGSNKNKQRQWDELNENDENIRYGTVPSLDGVEPIIFWESVQGGRSMIDGNGNLVDTQAWVVKTLSGHNQRIALDEVAAIIGGKSIPARINNWKAYMQEVEEIAELRLKYQTATGKRQHQDLVGLLQEINKRDRGLIINVTLSEDLGKTFTGKTLDIPARLWNM